MLRIDMTCNDEVQHKLKQTENIKLMANCPRMFVLALLARTWRSAMSQA